MQQKQMLVLTWKHNKNLNQDLLAIVTCSKAYHTMHGMMMMISNLMMHQPMRIIYVKNGEYIWFDIKTAIMLSHVSTW